MSNNKHNFHLVDPSPWPLISAFAAYMLATGFILYFHLYKNSFLFLLFGFLMIIFCMFVWWRDVIREATFGGYHPLQVQKGLKYGVILFIISEIMFFFVFFWGFFHSSLSPSIAIGAVWPPAAIDILNPWDVPFLNTVILLTSGATVTWAHHAIILGLRTEAIYALFFTIFFAILFLLCQFYEYREASFDISDGIYGSTFYMATGFHGVHVIIGTIFLTVCLVRAMRGDFTPEKHVGFEAAAWYWHFVDVVWLFLFFAVYIYGVGQMPGAH